MSHDEAPQRLKDLSLTGVNFIQYDGAKEKQYLPQIRQLISHDLSEPYSIYVYRYFLYQWGELCFMVDLSRLQLDVTLQRH